MEHSLRPGVGCRRVGCLCLSSRLDALKARELSEVQVLHVLSDSDIEKIKRDAYVDGVMAERRRWTWGE